MSRLRSIALIVLFVAFSPRLAMADLHFRLSESEK